MSRGRASQSGSEASPSAGTGDAARAGSPIDGEHLDRHTFGNPDLAREVLGLFSVQAEQLGARLGESEEPDELVRVVHTLKGSARGVGAWRVAEEAERVEAVLRTQQAADLSGLREALDEARDFIAMTLDAD
jgi:HPt (histidine-containing phosphotransfer) domain-containing protein